jgi:branched-chain amino acid transport system permease protein
MRLPLFAATGCWGWVAVAAAAATVWALPLILDDPFFILVMQSLGYLYIAALGLDILVGWSGQISLGHAGLYAVGAYTSALLATRAGLPFWITAPVGVAAAGLAGVLLALPSLRAKGPYLAMVTLAFGFMAEVTANRWDFTGGPMGIMGIPGPTLPSGEQMDATQYFWLIGATAIIVQLLAANLYRSRVGRTLFALQASEVAAETVGINVYAWKVLAFVLSSICAGLGGVFFAHQNGFINSDTFVFGLSVQMLTSVLMGGTGTLFGPLFGSLILNLVPTFFAHLHEYHLYIYGGVILVTIIFLPKGILGSLLQLEPVRRRLSRRLLIAPEPTVLKELGGGMRPMLAVTDLSKHFGGIRALNKIDLTITPGTVHGLIGPNGSGKSTFVNVLTGIYRPSTGSMQLAGREVAGSSPHAMARAGVTRTFQSVRLFGDLTVLNNVMVGFHLHMRRSFCADLLQTSIAVAEEDAFRAKAMALLEFVGVADKADQLAQNLPYGKQRLLEIARALATKPSLLLLDEPAAGVNPTELRHLADVIGRIKLAGVTQVVIEHHMELIMGISDTISVFDFGQKIAEGNAAKVQSNAKVIEAYLGTPTEIADA